METLLKFTAMKWYFYILILMAVACTGKVTISEDEIGPEVFYARNSYKPFSGKCIVVFNDTSLIKEQFTFKKGLLHGEAMAWYKNRQMRRKGSYQMGQIAGRWEFWDENGHKTTEVNYSEDILDGAYFALYANGKVKEKGQFAANRQVGRWEYYREDGQLIPVSR